MFVIKDDDSRKYYIIHCRKCGKEMKVRSDYIKKHSGICLSCRRAESKSALKHGEYKTRLYRIWTGLAHRRYTNYNPTVCEEWKKFENFKEWAINNGYNDNLTIDRINNKGDYEPSNCQWITLEENARKDKLIFSDAECLEIYNKRRELKLTMVEMAKKLSVSKNTILRAEKRAKEMM